MDRTINKVVFVFPGHGSQYVGMGKDIYHAYPEARAIFDKADSILDFPLSKLCFEGPLEELRLTVNVQPALLTVCTALLNVMQKSLYYSPPAFVAGHSLGEYTAAVACRAITFTDALTLVRQRGQLMHQAGVQKPGMAVAILGLENDTVAEIANATGVYVANYNCPGQVVVSGENRLVEQAVGLAISRGASRTVPIPGNTAFHSPLMKTVAQELAQSIATVEFNQPNCPLIGNTSASPLSSIGELQDELRQQLYSPVQWSQSIAYLVSQGVDLLVEIGPGAVLSGLNKHVDKQLSVANISDVKSIENYLAQGFAK
ncbi:MAG: ACP S-malonyltransferase [Dehalococcoidia bacterium]|nr:ACP S-malonyltransferase [Dehalococcoidia bacterium]